MLENQHEHLYKNKRNEDLQFYTVLNKEKNVERNNSEIKQIFFLDRTRNPHLDETRKVFFETPQ